MSGFTLYPQRQRCRACRRFFGPLVVRGQWCSYHCAGMDVPSSDPADWPRQHFTRRGISGPRIPKSSFNSEAEAEERAQRTNDQQLTIYLCRYCGTWHMGHTTRTEEG